MKNKQDFILKVENEGSLGSLNRLSYRYFDRDTTVWSDGAGHNILVFVLEGEASCSRADFTVGVSLHRKVTVLAKGEPFVVEFRAGCRVLSYPFDSYLPVEASVYEGVAAGARSIDDEGVAFDMPTVLHRLLVNIAKNIGVIGDNETLTHLAMRKVTGTMLKCLKPPQTAALLATGGSVLRSEIFRYAKIAENRTNLTKKPAKVIF